MSEAHSLLTSSPVFMENASEAKINALSDTTQGLFLAFHFLGSTTEEVQRREIAENTSPEMIFNSAIAPFTFFLTELSNFLANLNFNLKPHQRHRTVVTIVTLSTKMRKCIELP